jgi:hypothetical protein
MNTVQVACNIFNMPVGGYPPACRLTDDSKWKLNCYHVCTNVIYKYSSLYKKQKGTG